MHLSGTGLMKEREEAKRQEQDTWKSKVVVGESIYIFIYLKKYNFSLYYIGINTTLFFLLVNHHLSNFSFVQCIEFYF